MKDTPSHFFDYRGYRFFKIGVWWWCNGEKFKKIERLKNYCDKVLKEVGFIE